MARYSKEAKKVISAKMRKMRNEKRPRKQKIAIAISEARAKGLKVPPKKTTMAKTRKKAAKKATKRKPAKRKMAKKATKRKTTKRKSTGKVKACAKTLGRRGGKKTAAKRRKK